MRRIGSLGPWHRLATLLMNATISVGPGVSVKRKHL